MADTSQAETRRIQLIQECANGLNTPFYRSLPTVYKLHDLQYPLPQHAKSAAKRKVIDSMISCQRMPDVANFTTDWTKATTAGNTDEVTHLEYRFSYWIKELGTLQTILKQEGWEREAAAEEETEEEHFKKQVSVVRWAHSEELL